MEPDYNVDEKQHTLQHAAKILRTYVDMWRRERRREHMLICAGEREREREREKYVDMCRRERERRREQTTEVSFAAAKKCLYARKHDYHRWKKRLTAQDVYQLMNQPQTNLTVSQQLIQHISGIATPLGIATVYTMCTTRHETKH